MVTNVRQSEVLPNAKDYRSHPKKPGRLTIQVDEMWSFVGSKDNKQWVWLAIDAHSREIVGVFVGARSRQGAKGLWQSLPAVYRGAGDAPPPVSVRSATPIFGRRMSRWYLAIVIERLAKKLGKLAISSDSTTP